MKALKIEKLTIGQMARINHISEQTLRLYDRMDILKPDSINMQTGYRYYNIRQCARLDMIQYMKSMGMSLTEIKQQLNKGDVPLVRQVLQRQLQNLDKQIMELQNTKKAVERAAVNYDRYLSAPPDGIITTEFIPERKIYCYPLDLNFYEHDVDTYEYALQELKNHIQLNHLPLSYYCNVGNIIRKPYLEKYVLHSNEIFIFVDNDFSSSKIENIPAGLYACIYCDNCCKEKAYASRLFESIDHNNLTIIGDYLCEVVAELPVFKETERNTYIKLQIPVKYENSN